MNQKIVATIIEEAYTMVDGDPLDITIKTRLTTESGGVGIK